MARHVVSASHTQTGERCDEWSSLVVGGSRQPGCAATGVLRSGEHRIVRFTRVLDGQ